MELTRLNDHRDSAGLKINSVSNDQANKENLLVKFVAFLAFLGWFLCGWGYYTPSWIGTLIYLSSVLPFLFDIIFTFIHSDMFIFQFTTINAIIVTLLLIYNSLLLLPMFWQTSNIYLILARYIGSVVININCSLTMLRIHARCQLYLKYFNVTKLPIDEINTGIANRITSENDLTYSIVNIKENAEMIRQTIYYLRNRLLLTGPFYVCNLLAAVRTSYYAGFINIMTDFIPVSTPFLFLSLIIMLHNEQILRWEDYHLIESGCAVTLLGMKIRNAWILSLGSFLFITFIKLFVLY